MFKRYFQYVVYLVLAIGFSSAKAGAYEDFFKSVINDDARQVEQLLSRGFDPNSRDEKGQNLLYLSQRDGAFKVAQVLLDHPQIRIDQPNNAAETALMMAALRDHDTWVTRTTGLDAAALRGGSAGLEGVDGAAGARRAGGCTVSERHHAVDDGRPVRPGGRRTGVAEAGRRRAPAQCPGPGPGRLCPAWRA